VLEDLVGTVSGSAGNLASLDYPGTNAVAPSVTTFALTSDLCHSL
jgi:hypothetical protein